MNPFLKIALLCTAPALLSLFILTGPSLGLGSNEQFILYRWFGVGRYDSLTYVLTAAGLVLLYPIAAILAPGRPVISEAAGRHTQYRPEIDGLRAVAVLAVIINHTSEGVLPSGHLGVDIFFVISGFVIAGSLLTSKHNSVIEFLLDFYSKRVGRLVPALVLFVVTCAIAIALVSPGPGPSIRTGIASLFGVSNVQLFWQSTNYFAPETQYNTFTHTWSLGVEEQFYLLFPLLVYLCVFYRASKDGSRALSWTMAALTIASVVYYASASDRSAAFFLMAPRFWELGAGCLVYLALSRRPEGYSLDGFSGLLAVLLIGVLFAPPSLSIAATIATVVITGLLIAALVPGSATYKALTLSPVQFVGKISYSLYLWHWGILSISRWLTGDGAWLTPLVLCLMLGMATLSYLFVEAPLRSAARRAPNWKVIVFGVYACVLSVLFLGAIDGSLRGYFALAADRINPLVFQPQPLVQQTLSCHLPNVIYPIEECLTPRDPGKRILYVVGDSHATNHVPSLILAAEQFKNLEVRYLAEWGFISSVSGADMCKDHSSRPCIDDGFRRQLEFFSRNLKLGDLVAFSWARDRILLDGEFPRAPNQPALEMLQIKLIELRSVVTSKSANLILVDELPKPCLRRVNWNVIYATGKHEICSTSAALSKQDRLPLTELYNSLVADGVFYFDAHDALCEDGRCGIYDRVSGLLIYAGSSPHFPPSRPAPLVAEWASFISRLP